MVLSFVVRISLLCCVVGLTAYRDASGQDTPPSLDIPRPPRGGVDEEYLRRVREIAIARGKLKAANRELIEHRLERISPYFSLDAFLNRSEFSLHEFRLKSDNCIYELLSNADILDEIGIEPSRRDTVAAAAEDIRQDWRSTYRKFLESGDVSEIDAFAERLFKYSSSIEEQLTRDQLQALQVAQRRSQILAGGLPSAIDDLMANTGSIEKSELLRDLQRLAIEIKSDGNRLMVDEIQRLFPSYLESFDPADVDSLPLLPLDCFLAANDQPDNIRRHAQDCLRAFDVALEEGRWLYPGFGFREELTGGLSVSRYVVHSWAPISPVRIIASQSRLDLSVEQRRRLSEHLRNFADPDRIVPRTADRSTRRARVREEREKLDALLDDLFPAIQLDAVRNYVRIHAVFSLGPEVLFNQLEGPLDLDRRTFEKRLETTYERIGEFIDESEERIARAIANSVRQSGNRFDERLIDSPNASNYQRLLFPLLDATTNARR